MGIRSKAFRLIGITALVLILIVYLISKLVIGNSIKAQEIKSSKETVYGLKNIIDNECSYLNHTVTDWSQYDASYQFIKDHNRTYIVENLQDNTFSDINMNFIIFVRKDGKIVFEKGYDPDKGKPLEIPTELQNCLNINNPLFKHKTVRSVIYGLLYTNNRILLVSSHPITSSDTKAPANGTLIMGRFLIDEKIRYFEKITNSKISFYNVNDFKKSNEFKTIASEILGSNTVFVKPMNKDFIRGYTIYKDVNNRTDIMLSMTLHRDEYNKSLKDLKFLILALLASIAFVFIIFLSLIQKLVISRLEKLNDFINEVSLSGDTTSTIKLNGEDEISNLAGATNKMLFQINRAENELKELLVKVYSLLNNSEEGFLTFNKEFIIDSEYSAECRKIFGRDIADDNILELIFTDKSMNEEEFSKGISMIFETEDEFRREMIISLLPSVVNINSKIVKVKYKVLENAKIMLILTDITREKELESKIREEQQRLKLIVASFTNKDDIYYVIDLYKNFLTEDFDTIKNSEDENYLKLDKLYRRIHTMKGVFAQFSFINITMKLDDIENKLSVFKKDLSQFQDQINKIVDLQEIEKAFELDMKVIASIHGDNYLLENNNIILDEESAVILEKSVLKIIDRTKDIYKDEELASALNIVDTLRYKSLKKMLSSYPEYVYNLSERLGKYIRSFDIEGQDIRIDPKKYSNFIKSLIHVFRNAVDHGIETSEDRLELGKDELGSISCIVNVVDDTIEITIADDGKGIEIDKIKEKAIKKGVIKANSDIDLNNYKILDLVFLDDFSTKEEASDISGKGYGLSSVLNELNVIEGRVVIETAPNVGTKFVFAFKI